MRATINLYNEDCLPAMRKMADNQYSLAIVDPPFGIGKFWMKNKQTYHYGRDKEWNEDVPDQEYFNELFRVSKNQIIFGGNYYAHYLPITNAWIFWDKGISFETNLSMGQLAWTSFKHSMRYKKWLWSGACTNGIRYGVHPCEMPVGLLKWLLKNYAKPGDKILDTHFGSLSIGIACWDAGYDFDAFEIDRDYFEAGKKRLENHTAQLQIY